MAQDDDKRYAVVMNPNYLYGRNIEAEGSYYYQNLPHAFDGTYEECADWLDDYIKRNK